MSNEWWAARATRLRRGLVALWLLLAPLFAHAGFESIELSAAAPADATPAALLAGSDFAPQADRGALRPPDAGVHWWRLRPDADAAALRDPVLVIRTPRAARLLVHVAPDYAPQAREMFVQAPQQSFSRHALVVSLPKGGTDALLVRVERARTLPMKVEVLERDAYVAEDLGFVRRFGVVYTVLSLIGGVAFTFWLRLRDRMYLWFVAYVLGGHLLYFLCFNGDVMDVPLLGAMALAVTPYSLSLGANIAVAASVHFAQRFARLPQYAPMLSRLLWAGAAASWAMVLWTLVPWPADRTALPSIGNSVVLATYPTLLVASLLAWWRGSRAAGLFVMAWTPLVVATNALVVSIFAKDAPAWAVEMVLPVCACFTSLMLVLVLADRMQRLRRQRDLAAGDSERDPLTGVLNRRGLEGRLARAHAEASRQHAPYALLFVDLDHFKRINDKYGHAVGDRCLVALVARLRTELRQADALGRYGGEEFVVVLPGAGREQALAIAERMRADLESSCCEVDGHPVAMTASFGVAIFEPDQPCAAQILVQRADGAVYRAKGEGRNRVALHGAV